jgi:cytoskeletal protein CcmA (bactofilin family)
MARQTKWRAALSYFSSSKGDRDMKGIKDTVAEAKLDVMPAAGKSGQEIVSTFASGMLVTGNVFSTGAVQIFGRVIGDIHVARLLIGKGAYVEGKVTALDAVIDGAFKGTLRANNVKLQSTAAVDGEIYNKSLAIEQNAQFEGTARRLETQVEAPSSEQISGHGPVAALVPDATAQRGYQTNGAHADTVG